MTPPSDPDAAGLHDSSHHELVSVIFHPLNKVVSVRSGVTVLDAIRIAGIQFESICGGKGECGKCRVIFLRGSCDARLPDAVRGLSPEEIRRNYLLACKTFVIGNCEFIIPVESRIEAPKILLEYERETGEFSPGAEKYPIIVESGLLHPDSHRSLRLRGYHGRRPHMTRQQHNRIMHAPGPVTVTISTSAGNPEVIGIEDGDTTDHNYGLAIDLGTTTIAGVLINLTTGIACSAISVLNRQITFGEELITRIAAAKDPGGAESLQKAAVESINTVLDHMIADTGLDITQINDVCISGNTVMNHLLAGIDSIPLQLVNTAIEHNPIIVKAGNLGLKVNPEAYIYCVPNVSRFIGGDAVGDVIVSGMNRTPDLCLLIDLGTNGEVIVGNAEWLASASCASGPAFEGAGITCGMRAMKGAIDHIAIDPMDHQVSWTTIGDEKPRGICGSGIIDAAAAMFKARIIDFTGKIVDGMPGVRHSDQGPEYVIVSREDSATGRDIAITQQDMEYLIDSKAAACGAIGVLMKKYRIAAGDVRHVYLAGAFGAYTNLKSIIAFGIFPDFFNAEYHSIGNGSLAGACATLLSQKKRIEAESVARKMVYIDLLVDSDFAEEYSAATYIPGKKEYFPG